MQHSNLTHRYYFPYTHIVAFDFLQTYDSRPKYKCVLIDAFLSIPYLDHQAKKLAPRKPTSRFDCRLLTFYSATA